MGTAVTDDAILRQLSGLLAPPVVVIGVGNTLCGDDAFGPETVALLTGSDLPVGAVVLDGGVAPENMAERMAREDPATVLVVDAARHGGAVGELKVILPDELGWDTVETHAPSLELLSSYLFQRCGAKVFLLAAQPGDTRVGRPASREMLEAAHRAASIVRQIWRAGETGSDAADISRLLR